MWPVGVDFLAAVRRPHDRVTTATFRDPTTSKATVLPVEGGTVTDDATAGGGFGGIRRTLTLTVTPLQALYDTLDVPGGEITVTQTIRFPNGTKQAVPLGVFVVDQDRIGYSPGDTLELTCPDRFVKVQRARFTANRASVAANNVWQEIKRLVEGAWSGSVPFPGWASIDESATHTVGTLLWDNGDRGAAVLGLAGDSGLEVFFDRTGLAVLRPIPTTTGASVWTVDAGSNGVLVSADRSRDRSVVRNTVVVSTSATDVYFAPVVVSHTVGTDPLATVGPLGVVSEDYSSPNIRSSDQALAAGRARLVITLGAAKTLQLGTPGNPALDARDVVQVRLPNTDTNLPRTTEVHVLDTVTHPLTGADTQAAATRATRTDNTGS